MNIPKEAWNSIKPGLGSKLEKIRTLSREPPETVDLKYGKQL